MGSILTKEFGAQTPNGNEFQREFNVKKELRGLEPGTTGQQHRQGKKCET